MASLADILAVPEEGRIDIACPICGEHKRTYSGYAWHMEHRHLIRVATKRLPCPHCPASARPFDHFRALKQHYWKVHRPKNLGCPHGSCSYRCSMTRDLRYHERHCPFIGGADEGRYSPPLSAGPAPSVSRPSATATPIVHIRPKIPTVHVLQGPKNIPVIQVVNATLPQLIQREAFRRGCQRILPNGPLPPPLPPPQPRPVRRILPRPEAAAPEPAAKKRLRDSEAQTEDDCDLDSIVCLDFASQVSFNPGDLLGLGRAGPSASVALGASSSSADFFCQTQPANVVDAAVSADYSYSIDNAEEDLRQAILLSTIETQTDTRLGAGGAGPSSSGGPFPPPRRRRLSSGTLEDLAEILGIHNEETQTPAAIFAPPPTAAQQPPPLPAAEMETQTMSAWHNVPAIHNETQT